MQFVKRKKEKIKQGKQRNSYENHKKMEMWREGTLYFFPGHPLRVFKISIFGLMKSRGFRASKMANQADQQDSLPDQMLSFNIAVALFNLLCDFV